MPCGDTDREIHTHSYLLIATNKEPLCGGGAQEVSPMLGDSMVPPGWITAVPEGSLLPREHLGPVWLPHTPQHKT